MVVNPHLVGRGGGGRRREVGGLAGEEVLLGTGNQNQVWTARTCNFRRRGRAAGTWLAPLRLLLEQCEERGLPVVSLPHPISP